uniref:C-type lectin domain-containing protein n=1 Tax=Romanomermis culicivorax TaxID=13658 RepID=A0A915KZ50_ROMCU
ISIFFLALEAKCRENWQEYGGKCYKVFQDRLTTWPDAENNCQYWGDDVHLASIHSEKEMSFLFNLINDSQMFLPYEDHFHHTIPQLDSIWIGMTLFCPEGKPGKWTDGTKLDSYSLLKQRTNDEHIGSCVAYTISKLNPLWVVKGCGALYPYVCKSHPNENVQNSDDESRSLCGDWKWCRYEDKCYKIDTTPKIWMDAKTSCQNYGADLLSIHNENELNYILENFLKNWDSEDTFWTGLSKYESMDERFRWSDGTPLNYAPTTKIGYKEWRTASCFLLDPANGPMWKLDRCDEKHMSLCSKPAENFTAPANFEFITQKINGYCKTGWMKYDNKCYKAFGLSNSSRKENFFGAQNTCYMENAHLVSIKDLFENFFILSLLSGAKSAWIGLIQNSGSI